MTKIDYSSFQEDFDKVVAYSQDIPKVNTTPLLDKWAEAKWDFYRAFGGKLIYEVEDTISFQLTDEMKSNRIGAFCSDMMCRLDPDPEECHWYSFTDFLQTISVDEFYSNILSHDWESSRGDDIKINAGHKISKAFKYFILNKTVLDHWQSVYSEIIQENKIEGKLCFSIHPLDYLSVSENTYNWRSCHALDGEYRAGNLNYMTDKSTIVCYLKGKDNVQLRRFAPEVLWNSKKWRMLIFFDDAQESMFAGRPYPFDTPSALAAINKYLDKMFSPWGFHQHGWTDWSDATIRSVVDPRNNEDTELYSRYFLINHDLFSLGQMVHNGKETFHFNDLLNSSCYEPRLRYREGHSMLPNHKRYRFHIGDAAPCVCCGQANVAVSDSFMCIPCELKYGHSEDEVFCICSLCGDRGLRSDFTYSEYHDDYLCSYCYAEQEVIPCCKCGYDYAKSEMLVYEGDAYCVSCYDKYVE